MPEVIGTIILLSFIPILRGAYLILMDAQYEHYRKKYSIDKNSCNNNYLLYNTGILNNNLIGDNMNNNSDFNKFLDVYNNTVENPLDICVASSFMNSPRSLSHMAILRSEDGTDIALLTGANGNVKVQVIWRT